MEKIITLEQAKEIVVINFTKKYILRKLLIDKCIESLKLSKADLKDKSPRGVYNVCKCRLGNAIDLMIAGGYFSQDENKILCKLKEEKPEITVENVKRDNRIEKILIDLLSKKSYKRQELFHAATKQILATEKNITVQIARCDVGRLIVELKNAAKIEEKNGVLSLFSAKPQEAVYDIKKAFDALSDEELVDHSVALLEKWFSKCGATEITAQNTDGPNDNGIDGIISFKDATGFCETVILQVKHIAKKEKYVPLCEVREFIGVLAAHPTSLKGIFVTNAKFHKDTIKFANSYKGKYFLLLNGDNILKLAKNCGYNFIKS